MSGELLGRYELMNRIGEGAMGTVYRAKDTRLGRIVALKVMSASLGNSPESIARFEREARSLAALQHPNIVTIYDFPELQGNLCITMELIPGEPMDKVIAQRLSFTVDQKLRFMIAVCRALNYAHGQGVIHRDLKPSNILVLADCSPKIVDFGIAKIMAEKLTRTNTRIGTIAYMSPEQINGKPIDHRTDIFSAGVVLYEFLSLSSPFDASDTTSTMRKILLEPTPRLPDTIAGISPRIHQLLLTALSKDPAHRFQTAEEMARELELCLSTARPNGRPQSPMPPPVMPKRHPSAPLPPPPATPYTPRPGAPQPFGSQPNAPQQFAPVIPPSQINPQYMHYPGKPRKSSWVKPFLVTLGIVLFIIIVICVLNSDAFMEGFRRGYNRTSGEQTTPDPAPQPQVDYTAMYNQAEGYYGKKQYADAKPLYDNACNGGSADACERVGEMLYMGRGVTEDDSAALPYFEATCPKDNFIACNFLGLMYERGDSVTADATKAVDYYVKSCTANYKFACDRIDALCTAGNANACQSKKT